MINNHADKYLYQHMFSNTRWLKCFNWLNLLQVFTSWSQEVAKDE